MNYIIPYQTISPILFNGNDPDTDETICDDDNDAEIKDSETEEKIKKQRADAEKNAERMQKIWGNNFQSDSLH